MGFQFNFTQDQLQAIIPQNQHVGEWYEALAKILPDYDITTVERVVAFLAQCGHESAGFTATQENLNYGATGLMATFKKYFPTQELANLYARKPEKIANRVYASRMGNSDEASGDGWKYRGRGLIQLTGKNNYTAFATSIDTPIEEVTEYLQTIEGCVRSACWFWQANNLNQYADAGDVDTMTKRINGGLNGIDDRRQRQAQALQVLGA
jgi:putative chitinase